MKNRTNYRLNLLVFLLLSLFFTACSSSTSEPTKEPETDKFVAASDKDSDGVEGASSLEGTLGAASSLEGFRRRQS